MKNYIYKISIALLLMTTCAIGAWGQNTVYVYVSNGHYLAHCGKDVSLSSPIQATAPTAFNPNTCLWEVFEVINSNNKTEYHLRAYGTESLEKPYYLNVYAASNYYTAVVSLTSRNYGGYNQNDLRTWPKTLTGNTSNSYPSHYVRYHATIGWIAAENTTDVYTSSSSTTTKAVTITNDVGSYQGPQVSISGVSEISDFGSYSFEASAVIGTTTYSNYYFNNANHYWYDNSDHGNETPVDWSGSLTYTWSIADNGGYANIDANGNVSIQKIPIADIALTLQLTVTDGTHTCVFTKIVILKGGHTVLKDSDGRFIQVTSNNAAGSTSFAPSNSIWKKTNYDYQHDNYTNGTNYLSIGNSNTRVTLSTSEGYSRRWRGGYGGTLINANNLYASWDNSQNVWILGGTEPEKPVKVYPVTLEQEYYTDITAAMSGETAIDYEGDFTYTIGNFGSNLQYTAYTFDNNTHYWYDSSDHNTAPEYWGDISDENLTKTWSLTGNEGISDYAEVNAATGVLTVKALPESGTIPFTLKCTITKSYNNQNLSHEVSKEITLKPEVMRPPVISVTGSQLSLTSPQSGATIYYETGPTEPTTKEPTTASTIYHSEEPPTIGNDVTCIKAIAVHQSNYSVVTTYNILPFTDTAINAGAEEDVTVAPLIYSTDLETPTGMNAYIVKRVTTLDKNVVLKKVDYIPEGVPVLLLDNNTTPSTGSTYVELNPIDLDELNSDQNTTNDITPISASDKATNLLKVSDGTVEVQDAQVYMYYNGEFVLTFGGTLKEGRFYLYNPNYNAPVTTPSASRLSLIIEDTTGIDDVCCNKEEGRSDTWYTIDGRRLTGHPTAKGIYIIRSAEGRLQGKNGQKMVIK